MGATVSGELSQGEFIALQFSIPSVSLELRARVCHRRGYFYGFEFLIVSDMQPEHVKDFRSNILTRTVESCFKRAAAWVLDSFRRRVARLRLSELQLRFQGIQPSPET